MLKNSQERLEIVVVGAGYVGLSNAVVLAQRNKVIVADTDESRVAGINSGRAPFHDVDLQEVLSSGMLDLQATTDAQSAYAGADLVIVATPTNFNESTGRFDTESVESVIANAATINPRATIAIKSTVPVGFTKMLASQFPFVEIYFSPEFLREGRALHEGRNPSRIVVGGEGEKMVEFGELLRRNSSRPDVPVLYTSSSEAEAIKLFANTYLAMRVAFFNELDTYAVSNQLDARKLVDGVCLDPRIGDYYNNPSFGYGGYCLPKDAKQLVANYADIPHSLIAATVESNRDRKDFIANEILRSQPKIVGVYGLMMKHGSDNSRGAAIFGVMRRLSMQGVKVVVFESRTASARDSQYPVEGDLNHFKEVSDVIITNRQTSALDDVAHKVYTRDLFNRD